MIDLKFATPQELATHIAKAAQEQRLSLNLTQRSLAERSGVSLGVLKKFETTHQISLASLLKLAFALGCLGDFAMLFPAKPPTAFTSLDQLLKHQPRKRGSL